MISYGFGELCMMLIFVIVGAFIIILFASLLLNKLRKSKLFINKMIDYVFFFYMGGGVGFFIWKRINLALSKEAFSIEHIAALLTFILGFTAFYYTRKYVEDFFKKRR